MNWVKMMILLVSVSCITGCTAHAAKSPSIEMNVQLQDELKPIVKELFAADLVKQEFSTVSLDKRILDYKIHDDIQMSENSEALSFTVSYDILPASLEFILAGSGERADNGWIINMKRHITLEKVDGEYRIKILSSGR
ncbi:hypothetical protein D3C86_1771120 [compost metagenome]